MTYDPVDTNDDGVVDADVDNQSVNTDREHITRQSPIVIGSVGFRSDFDGSDPDTRLDNAQSAADIGDTIILESVDYDTNRTFSTTGLSVVGNGGWFLTSGRTAIKSGADWTFSNDGQSVDRVQLRDDNTTLTFEGIDASVMRVQLDQNTEIKIDDGRTTLSHIHGGAGDVTFTSNANSGEIGVVSGNITITDNGSNRVI